MFKFNLGERVLIAQLVNRVKDLSKDENYALFKQTRITVNVKATVIGTLFSNIFESKGPQRKASKPIEIAQLPATEMNIDDHYEKLKQFIINCAVANIRAYLRTFAENNHGETAYMIKCTLNQSVNEFDPKIRVNLVDLKSVMSRASIPKHVHIACLFCIFRHIEHILTRLCLSSIYNFFY